MKITFTFLIILFSIQNIFAQIKLTAEEWRADLRHLQQTVHEQYDFLFKKVTAEQFDKEVELLYEAIPQLEDHELIVGLAKLVALFKYGHTSLNLNGWRKKAAGFQQMPYNLYHFSDGVYVQGTHQKYKQALGAKVIKIGKTPVEEALAAIRPVVSAENDQYFKAFGLFYLGTAEVLHAQKVIDAPNKGVSLTLEKDGKTFDITFESLPTERFPGQYGLIEQKGEWLDARDQSQSPLYLSHLDKKYFFKYLADKKTVYVRQSQVLDEEEENLSTFYNKIFDFIEKNEVERMVLDVRLNGGGNNYKNKPVVTGVIRTEKINQSGKFFVILGRRTFSACQNLVNELHNYTNAIFVGEPTSENINFYGDNRQHLLPNSQLPVLLSFAWWQDKPQWENNDWLAPQIAIDMSFEEFRSNQDPVLEAIWENDALTPIVEPMAYLIELFSKGELEKVKSEAERLVKDKRYRYYNFESQFNRAGYNLLRDKRTKEAVFVFELNADLFPQSANAWDSLAEGNWKLGNKEKAKTLYQKVIEMDKGGPIAANAEAMLKKMNEEGN